jgi:hypothetical protein
MSTVELEAIKKKFERWDELEARNYEAYCAEMGLLSKTDPELHVAACFKSERSKFFARHAPPPPPEPPPATTKTPDFLTFAEYKKLLTPQLQATGRAVNKFVREFVAQELGPVKEKLTGVADAARVAELQAQIVKLEARLVLCERSEAAHRRHLQELEKKIGKKNE